MVATVLRLRYRILGNTLARSPWQIVGFCLGLLGGLWIVGLVVVGVIALAILGDLELTGTIAVVGGSLLLLGWVLGPVLVAGMDSTVDAGRLAPFPLTLREVMITLVATGLTGIPGIATALAVLSSVALWVRWPAAAVAAVPCVLIALLTCVLASRLITTLSGGTGRRGQELVGTVVLIVLVMTGPILTGVFALLDRTADLAARLGQIVEILGWTPIGAAWAVPGDIAAGSWLIAVAKLAIAVLTVAVLWLVWQRALRATISAPPRRAVRSVKAGRIGLFGVMPTGGTGATWARSLSAWLRDPRYLRQLIIAPILPILFVFTSGIDGPMFAISALIVAFVLSFAGYTDISYDGTAFATVLATGVRGRADRLGRALGAASVTVPLVVLIAVVVAIVSDTLDWLPAVLGGSLGLLLVGLGVTAVSSAMIVTPVASPGDSPFKSVPGQTFITGLMVFVVWGICMVVAIPALVLSIIALVTADTGLGWIALAVGLVYGAVIVIVGVVVGGRVFDRSGPELLGRIKAFPTS